MAAGREFLATRYPVLRSSFVSSFTFVSRWNRVGSCMVLSIVCKRGEEIAVEVVVDRLQAADLIHIKVRQAIKPFESVRNTSIFNDACVSQRE